MDEKITYQSENIDGSYTPPKAKNNKKIKVIISVIVLLILIGLVFTFFVFKKGEVPDVPAFSLSGELGSKDALVPDDFPFISEGVNVNSLESFDEKKGLHTYTARWNSDLSGKEVYNRLFEYAKSNNWEVLPGEGEDTYYIQAGKDSTTFVAFISGSTNPFIELTFYQTQYSPQ